MKEIATYVERTFESVPDSQRKSEIMQEIIERLEDSAGKLEQDGKAREDAINKAIVDFGNLDEILQELRGQETGKGKALSSLWFAVIGSLLVIALTVFINLYYSPGVVWFLYPTFAVIWWPLCIFFFGKWRKGR
ncbi:MAG: permease prefix domain 1-containing protein [Oscillospiraceae bacterium]|jgi:hypothetical protein|nr:permease prefix domain 1-containing protein [Oscillospiraceae bacterium]